MPKHLAGTLLADDLAKATIEKTATLQDLERIHGIPQPTLRRWRMNYEQRGETKHENLYIHHGRPKKMTEYHLKVLIVTF